MLLSSSIPESNNANLVAKVPPVIPRTALYLFRQQNQPEQHRTLISLLLPSTSSDNVGNATPALRLYNGITEIAGEAGSGKSQIAMSLCVSAILPPLTPGNPFSRSNKAIYIWTGGTTSHSIATIIHRRLRQMIQRRLPSSSDASFSKLEEIALANIYIKSSSTIDQFKDLLGMHHHQKKTGELEMLLQRERGSVKLVVIDSIGGLFRTPEEENDDRFISQRATALFQAAAILKRLSDIFNFPVLVVNQVSSVLTGDGLAHSSTSNGTKQQQPSLGLSWSNCINTRYMIFQQQRVLADVSCSQDIAIKSMDNNQNAAETTVARRHLALILSPRFPNSNKKGMMSSREGIVYFEISADGVHEV